MYLEVDGLSIYGLASYLLPSCEVYLNPAPPPPPSPPPSLSPNPPPPLLPPPPSRSDSDYYWYEFPEEATAEAQHEDYSDIREHSLAVWKNREEQLRCEPDRRSGKGTIDIDVDKSMCTALSCGKYRIEQPLFQFSYWYSISDLFKVNRTLTADGKLHPTDVYEGPGKCTLDGKCPKGSSIQHPGRIGAVLLFISSFLWPHVKLTLLHFFFYARVRPSTRRNGNYWLAFFGKWSFADVLVMISLLGVLDLHIDKLILDIEGVAFSTITASVSGQLRLEGQLAMYWFCLSVVFSLSIGVFVDQFEDDERQLQEQTTSSSLNVEQGQCMSRGGLPKRTRCLLAAIQSFHTLLTAATLVVLLAALRAPLIRRVVTGSVSEALREFGVELNQSYSLLDLGWLSSRAGGMDYIMSGTFWIFVVIGPVARSVTLLVLLIVPLPLSWQRMLHQASRHVSVFYALEVMAVAVPLLNSTISGLANGLLTTSSLPQCILLNKQYGVDSCLTIDVLPQSGYYLMCAAVVLSFITGFEGSLTHKFIHSSLYPYDKPPPTCNLKENESVRSIPFML